MVSYNDSVYHNFISIIVFMDSATTKYSFQINEAYQLRVVKVN